MASNPTVLFIHGSWHQPSHFVVVRRVFADAGYASVCPLLPSSCSKPPVGLLEDAQCIKDELAKLIDDEEKDVVVVAHSYGGLVASQAVHQSFGRAERQKTGRKGGVVQILYMVAFLLPSNVSLMDVFGGRPPFTPVDDDGMISINNPEILLFHDLPEAEQQFYIEQLVKCPAVVQELGPSYAAYLYHPITYLYCENDRGFPLEVQQGMVKTISEGCGISIATETCSSSHSPFLSMPQRVLEVVQKIAA